MEKPKTPRPSEVLIPRPLVIVDTPGFFNLATSSIMFDHVLEQESHLAAIQLGSAIHADSLKVRTETTSSIQLRIRVETEALNECAFRIEITPLHILCESSTAEGIWHAVQILRQLAMTYGNNIPCCTICDGPHYGYRGLMLDCSRHYFSSDFITSLIDMISMLRMNRFHWHLTDDQGWRFPVKTFPNLEDVGAWRSENSLRVGGVYSHKEIQDIVAYAQKRHVMVIPEIDMPGHTTAALAAYPDLGCTKGPYHVPTTWGIFEDVLCAGSNHIIRFMEETYGELANCFTSAYVHIGGDECPTVRWKSCTACNELMHRERLRNIESIQGWFTRQAINIISGLNKKAIAWDEVLESIDPERDTNKLTIMAWRGHKRCQKAVSAGFDVISSLKDDGCYLDYRHTADRHERGNIGITTVRQSYDFSPMKPEDSVYQEQFIGGQGNLWTEYITDPEEAQYMLFPRLCAISEALWLPVEKKDYDSFVRRWHHHTKRLEALNIRYYQGEL